VLLDEGADVNTQGGYHRNALKKHQLVSRAGSAVLVEGADVNAQGGLQVASADGHEKVV
jgi:hypothetical protein